MYQGSHSSHTHKWSKSLMYKAHETTGCSVSTEPTSRLVCCYCTFHHTQGIANLACALQSLLDLMILVVISSGSFFPPSFSRALLYFWFSRPQYRQHQLRLPPSFLFLLIWRLLLHLSTTGTGEIAKKEVAPRVEGPASRIRDSSPSS